MLILLETKSQIISDMFIENYKIKILIDINLFTPANHGIKNRLMIFFAFWEKKSQIISDKRELSGKGFCVKVWQTFHTCYLGGYLKD